jgi:hypothetical protein
MVTSFTVPLFSKKACVPTAHHLSWKNAIRRVVVKGVCTLTTAVLTTVPIMGQGIFLPIGIPTTAIRTGHTELIGPIHLALRQGTTTADVIRIDPSPLLIKNASAADIQVTVAGNLVAGSPTIDSTVNVLRVPINAGGSAGSLRITGLRLSLDGATTPITVRTSFEQLNIMLEPSALTVVDSLSSGLTSEVMTDSFVIVNGQVIDSTATIPIKEAFVSAFSNSANFGQTTGTQIRIKVSDFPAGLRMSFPASITAAESTATLTTVGGAAVELLRGTGTTEVSYVFNQAANSFDTLESFDITFTVSTSGPIEILQPTIEVSLGPIGASTPTSALPSTAIPRFAEDNLLVLAGSSRTVSRRFYWTGINADQEHRLTLLNAGTRASNVTLERFGADGAIRSSTQLALAPGASWTGVTESTLPETLTTPTSIRVSSTEENLWASGNVRGSGVEESIKLPERGGFDFSLFTSTETEVNVWNINGSVATGTLDLRSASGSLLESTPILLEPMASLGARLDELFPGTEGNYVTVRFDHPVVVTTETKSSTNLTIVSPDPSIGKPVLFAPFAVSGNGYETVLRFINTSNAAVTLTANFIRAGATDSVEITTEPGELYQASITDLFPPAQGLESGNLRLDLPAIPRAVFTTYPSIAGHVEIRFDHRAATIAPLLRNPLVSSTFVDLKPSGGRFAGIATVNPGSLEATATFELLDSDSSLLEMTTTLLEPGVSIARLLGELFSVAIPEDAVVRVSSEAPLFSTAITGSTDGDILSASPGFP